MVDSDFKTHEKIKIKTSNVHRLPVRKIQRTRTPKIRGSHAISLDERQKQYHHQHQRQQQQATPEKLKGTASFPMNRGEARQSTNPLSKQCIKSFIFSRSLIWSLLSFYTVLMFFPFMPTSILKQSTSSSSTISLSTLLEMSSEKRPLLAQVDTDQQEKTQFLQTYIDKRLAELTEPVGYQRPSFDPRKKTLALLYPQGMIGGYRNQVIRFISFVRYARNNNISQILLPSIVWSTTHVEAENRKRFFPVPMDMLFDIDHWNSFHDELPILVDSIKDSDCWGKHNIHEYRLSKRDHTRYISTLSQKVLDENALLTPIVNFTRSLLNGDLQIRPRHFDLFPLVENCNHPIVYGGGMGGGTLWDDFMSMPKIGIRKAVSPEAKENTKIISLVNQALIPNQQWRNVAHMCISQHQSTEQQFSSDGYYNGTSNYVALHARVETDMMTNPCSKYMERNLTRIFDMVDDMVDQHNFDKQDERDKLQGVFVAVSREGMTTSVRPANVLKMADYNWNILLERSITENPNRKIESRNNRGTYIFECGELWTDRWYAAQEQRQNNDIDIEYDYYGSILPSIINFYIATHARIFIGVQGSSWSTDVWNTRYYQGNGDGNYEYTLTGIQPLSNGGLPPPHQNC